MMDADMIATVQTAVLPWRSREAETTCVKVIYTAERQREIDFCTDCCPFAKCKNCFSSKGGRERLRKAVCGKSSELLALMGTI